MLQYVLRGRISSFSLLLCPSTVHVSPSTATMRSSSFSIFSPIPLEKTRLTEYMTADQYVEFRRDVWGLHQNLKQLQAVFEKVHSVTVRDIPGGCGFYDTDSLNDVLDHPLITIQECWRFLHENVNFRNNGSHIIHIMWNVSIEDNIEQLHKKIRFHNVKILALLKPLELKLLLDIRSLITQYGEAILRELNRSEERRVGKECPV